MKFVSPFSSRRGIRWLAIVLLAALPLAAAAAPPRRGDLLLTERDAQRVLIVRAGTGKVEVLAPTVGPSLLVEPTGIVVGRDGSIYVADLGLDRIVRIDPTTGEQSILRSINFNPFGGGGGPLVIPNPFALDHITGILGDDQLYVKGNDELWFAARNLLTGWSAASAAQASVLQDVTDLVIPESILENRPVWMSAARHGVIGYFPPNPCCNPILEPEPISQDGQPAYHYASGIDQFELVLYVSELLVRESDTTCLPGSGLSRVIRIGADISVVSQGGLLRCPWFLTAGLTDDVLYVLDYSTFYGTEPRVVALRRQGTTWTQSALTPVLAADAMIGGMTLFVPEPDAASAAAVALLALAARARSGRAPGRTGVGSGREVGDRCGR